MRPIVVLRIHGFSFELLVRFQRPLKNFVHPIALINSFTASLFNKYALGIRIIQTKMSKRANNLSVHFPAISVCIIQYRERRTNPDKNSSIQEIIVICIPIVCLRRLLRIDSSDKDARTFSLFSDLAIYASVYINTN